MAFVNGRVLARRDWVEGLITLTIEAEIQPFKPGQFLNLGLRIGDHTSLRPYSMASAPGAPLEFYLSEVEEGDFSPSLCCLQPGDSLLVDPKPNGFFTLDWVPEARDLWLMATGTGLGPFISMLRAGELFRKFAHVVVVHGVRSVSALGYSNEIEDLAARNPGRLTYVPAVTRDNASAGVTRGRITSALLDGRLERAAGRELADHTSQVMLCGNPGMVEEMLKILAGRGLLRHRTRRPGHVTIEKYWD